MRTSMKFANPENITMTLTVTMTIAERRALKATLPSVWPSSELGYAIRDLVKQAEVHLEPAKKSVE